MKISLQQQLDKWSTESKTRATLTHRSALSASVVWQNKMLREIERREAKHARLAAIPVEHTV